MYKILEKQLLNPTVTRMVIDAPRVAKKAKAGMFIILRVDEDGERIPLTIADYDSDKGTVTIIFQIVGATTHKLNMLNAGDSICDFVGPLGNPTELDGLKKVAVIGGGVGCAIAYPTAKALHRSGATVHSVIGFRNKDLVILRDEFKAVSDKLLLMSDDGSAGQKGLVTDALKTLIEQGNEYDEVIAIGPLVMMKFVCKLTEQYGIKTVVSMNPIRMAAPGHVTNTINDAHEPEVMGVGV
ncbi:MAG: sulfide/dihydroorotate dehydrogenase-like FAD/NAD-binding protein, partial [Clostridiales bacterium]|nr:sulfide/dihydroorotate dehydrogenase-like FAD/NAD-binding protein [Clostridiales bacterium]